MPRLHWLETERRRLKNRPSMLFIRRHVSLLGRVVRRRGISKIDRLHCDGRDRELPVPSVAGIHDHGWGSPVGSAPRIAPRLLSPVA